MLIWITGLSGAGKTSLSVATASKLRDINTTPILLDGDEMRGVFGDKWGYTFSERQELAYVYARNCKMLSDQGFIVICATVAMFDDVRHWNRENNENYLEVFLDVPFDELVRRDQKGLYTKYRNASESNDELPFDKYQLPTNPDIRAVNVGLNALEETANDIVTYVKTKLTASN